MDSSTKTLEHSTESKSDLEDGEAKVARESKRIMIFKIAKQASLVMAWISIGTYVEIVGPTLKDLMYRVQQNYDQISQALALKSIGSVVGAPIGGLLCSRFNKHVDLLLSLAAFVAAAGTLFMPWFTSVEGVDAMMFFTGVSESISDRGFSIDEASNLNSAFWISFTVGRFSGTILSIWIKPVFMLSIQCTCLLAITLVLVFFGNSNDTVLWVFIVAFAWFESQVFPSGMAWANNYMEMTSMAVCIVMMGAFSGGFIYQRLTGFLFEAIGYKVFLFVLLGYAVCLSLFFVPLVIVARRQGPRVFHEEQTEVDADATSETRVSQL